MLPNIHEYKLMIRINTLSIKKTLLNLTSIKLKSTVYLLRPKANDQVSANCTNFLAKKIDLITDSTQASQTGARI